MAACYCTGACTRGACPLSPTPGTPRPLPLPAPWPPGQIQVIPAPLTADDVRRIIREELDRGEK